MKGLDGIRGSVYIGTGCAFYRQALYGYGPPSSPSLPKTSFSCCCPSKKKQEKDMSELHQDTKREELDAVIFTLKELSSKISFL